MSRFKESRDKGARYLLTHMRPDGGFGDPKNGARDYYKTIWALQCAGHTNDADRLCDWVRRNGLRDNGDFGPRAEGGDGYAHYYLNLWIVIGAQRLGQFDIASRGMDYVMGFRDAGSGGFNSANAKLTPDRLQDLWIAAFAGLAALYTGRNEAATGVGRMLRKARDAQPNFPAQLHGVYSSDTGLVTTVPEKDAMRYVVNGAATVDQQFFQAGAVAAFLARLYQATHDRQWLDLSMDYMRFAENAGDFQFKLIRAGKVGYAASVLYTITGGAKYRDMAIRIGNNLIALQSPEGWWSTVSGKTANLESTAERVAWMDEIYQAVGHI